jgi:tripartite-type tricarboxylate transporter receptor subunit TctC
MAPAGTPRPVVERLNHAVNEVLELPEVKAQMEANGASAPVFDTKQFGDLIEEHTRVWQRIVKPLNLQLD